MSKWPRRAASFLLPLLLAAPALAQRAAKPRPSPLPTPDERAAIEAKLDELAGAVKKAAATDDRDALADVEIALKAAAWTLKYDEFFDARDVARTLKTIDMGLTRAAALKAGRKPWVRATGSTARGYRSKVDGSIQPYAVVVPANMPAGKARLDVVLHGRDGKISEVRFIDAHDGKPAPDGQTGIVLHVYGRGNNAFRWAGETDVFEAIDAVRRDYPVDDDAIVLRGFSMGGAGAWHLGLRHPSFWASVEAGAGFTETIRYARLGDPSETTRKLLRIYDAVDYARNAFDVPIAGYGGENDAQAQASLNVLEALRARGVAMKTEGLVTVAEGPDFRRIVGKGMGHAVDKESARLLKAFHDERVPRGRRRPAARIRFVTYTLKSPRVGWLTVLRLGEHYAPATLDADLDDGAATVRTENVAALAVDRGVADRVRLDGRDFALAGDSPQALFRKTSEGWRALGDDEAAAVLANADGEKAPGVQGPIDDAFTAPFLCVRGTGTPADPDVQVWADARLKTFADDWERWMRGELPIKNDVEVTDDDVKTRNLVLFGDPGSNSWIAKLAPDLGLTWTPTELKLRGEEYAGAGLAPVSIKANPRNPLRYVVVNSGMSFGEKEFKGTNALLYPHVADFAVYRIAPGATAERISEGFFDEAWE